MTLSRIRPYIATIGLWSGVAAGVGIAGVIAWHAGTLGYFVGFGS